MFKAFLFLPTLAE